MKESEIIVLKSPAEIEKMRKSNRIVAEVLAAINRRLLDDKFSRYFFMAHYSRIKILNVKNKSITLKLHPQHPRKGFRKFNIDGEFFICNKDLNNIKEGKLHRLMDCLNFRKIKNKYIFDSWDYEKYKKSKDKGSIIHYLSKDNINIEVVMDNSKVMKGIAEKDVKKVKVGEVVQFERMFFARLDSKDKNKLVFYYSHK